MHCVFSRKEYTILRVVNNVACRQRKSNEYNPSPSNNPNPARAFFLPVKKHKEAEKALKKVQKQAKQAQKKMGSDDKSDDNDSEAEDGEAEDGEEAGDDMGAEAGDGDGAEELAN